MGIQTDDAAPQVRFRQQTLLQVLVGAQQLGLGETTHHVFRNDDYLAKADIPVDMHLVDRILAGEA